MICSITKNHDDFGDAKKVVEDMTKAINGNGH